LKAELEKLSEKPSETPAEETKPESVEVELTEIAEKAE
jgi:hypothetical protein